MAEKKEVEIEALSDDELEGVAGGASDSCCCTTGGSNCSNSKDVEDLA